MKQKILFALLFSFIIFQASAQQRATPDTIKTNKGPLTIQPIMHGSLVLNWNGKTIYVDPYGGAEAYQGLTKPDLILITDIHGDHLDKKTLDGLETGKAIFVVPQAVMDQLPEQYKSQARVLANGANMDAAGIPIKAIPMYNLPETEDAKHTKGRGNGYILDLGGKNVYISGDTEDIPEMRALKNIDVAFVSMNLPYTMNIDQAASAVLEFKSKIIYPYHYRGQNGFSDVEAFKNMVSAKNKKIDVRLKDWYPQKQ
ncbi:MBL fold metallo-hydrolase [Pontibacter sp. MBLB2868]|uniref:MBL fold metallo-hydrolase n=1 Tax=Pontibacter sp. MBLB2868 TaxID=3451555 RepID=UPI003F753836